MNQAPSRPGVLQLAKRLCLDLKDPYLRLYYAYFLIRNLPGEFGILMRRRVLAPHFARSGRNLKVHPGVRFRNIHQIAIGDNVELGVDNFFQGAGELTIHDGTILGPGVKIWTANHRFDDPDRPIMEQGYDYLPVTVGPNVWIGANAFIMPGVELGEGCVVSACAVVGAKKYPPYSILAGNPARVIGNRRKPAPGAEPAAAPAEATAA